MNINLIANILERISVTEELIEPMGLAAKQIVDFFSAAVVKGDCLTVRQLYNRETTWRNHHRKIDHPRLRQLVMVARELVVPDDYEGIEAIGPLVDYHPAPSPLTLACQRAAALADQLEVLYVNWRLRLPDAALSKELATAEIVFLSVCRGGLVTDIDLKALAATPIKELIGVQIPKGNESMTLPWIVPPAEAVVALQTFHARHPDQTSLLAPDQDIAFAMTPLLAQLDRDMTTEALFRVVRQRVRRDAPDWLARLILGQLTDTPALPCSRARILSGLPMTTKGPDTEEADEGQSPALADTTPSAPMPATPTASKAFLARVRKALLSCTRATLRPTLRRNLWQLRDDAPDTLCWLLASLTLHWLKDSGSPTPRSIARYLSSLMHLPRAAGLQVPFIRQEDGSWQADPTCWENMLSLAADPRLCTDKGTPRELFRLHQFTARQFPILEECDLEDIEDLNFPHHARATVVTDQEMRRAVARMQQTGPSETGPCLLGEIAYAAGCRLKELTHARLSDLQIFTDGRMTLEIRSHSDRSLKRRSSRRDIPLHILLDESQLQRLRDYAQALAILDFAPRQTYLFATLDNATSAPTRAQCYGLIAILRDITGDDSITFHSLRHSAANWLMLQMLCWEIPGIALLPLPGLDAARFQPEQVRALVISLCPEAAMAPPNRLPETWTQSLARLMGHSSPRSTLHHYLHLRPLYQSWVLARDLEELPTSLLARLADMPDRTQRRHITQWRDAAPKGICDTITCAQILWHIHREATQEKMVVHYVQQAWADEADAKEPARGSLRIAAIPQACQLAMANIPVEKSASAFGCPIASAQRVYDALLPKIINGYHAPALDAPSIMSRTADLADFRKLACNIDRDRGRPHEHDALSRIINAEKRWALDSDKDCIAVVGYLFRVLPKEGVIYVELQAMDGHNADMTIAQREQRWRDLITDPWGNRLQVTAYRQSVGPTWRDRPKPRGPGPCTEWAHLRVGKLPWPEAPHCFERCPGYTRALHCLRVLYDLRTPTWRLYR